MDWAFVAVIVVLFALRAFEIVYTRYSYRRLQQKVYNILQES